MLLIPAAINRGASARRWRRRGSNPSPAPRDRGQPLPGERLFSLARARPRAAAPRIDRQPRLDSIRSLPRFNSQRRRGERPLMFPGTRSRPQERLTASPGGEADPIHRAGEGSLAQDCSMRCPTENHPSSDSPVSGWRGGARRSALLRGSRSRIPAWEIVFAWVRRRSIIPTLWRLPSLQ